LILNIDKVSPVEFEHFCADILRKNGWKARLTQASGDQGWTLLPIMAVLKPSSSAKCILNLLVTKQFRKLVLGKP